MSNTVTGRYKVGWRDGRGMVPIPGLTSPRVSPGAGVGTKEDKEARCCSDSVPAARLSVDEVLLKFLVRELALRNGLRYYSLVSSPPVH